MSHRRLILGTAGHVDHGKTELVNALTGVDTDRLKEEKERGISIELGFAPLRLGDDIVLGVVDVPGHERFVKQMVAGAGGIDLAILVIAADEGVMPQTREHLEVLRALDVRHGAVVFSKKDLSSDDMMILLREEVDELVRGTFLEDAPVIETSAKTADGLPELRAALTTICENIPERSVSGPFRLAVDRVFGKQGIGVVVTGSGYSGTINVGDSLELLPSKKAVRVRAIQSFGEQRERGFAGERLAIALQGRKLGDLPRGEMLVTPSCFEEGYMVDARIHVAEYGDFEIKQRERVRVHHGAREVFGRIVLLNEEVLKSGDDAFVQLRLEKPIVSGKGDFIVLRKYSPSRVIGGGRVLDPSPKKHRRFDETVIAELAMREKGDPTELAGRAIADTGLSGVKIGEVDPSAVETLAHAGKVTILDDRVYTTHVLQNLASDAHKIVEAFVRAHPLRRGIDKEELRQKVSFPTPKTFNRVLEVLGKFKPLHASDKYVRTEGADVAVSDSEKAAVDSLERAIKTAWFLFPRHSEMASSWRGRHSLADALQYLRDEGRITRIADDRDMHTDALNECLGAIDKWFSENDELGVQDFKSLFGMTRKNAIPLLEYMDARRITVRRGDTRSRGPEL